MAKKEKKPKADKADFLSENSADFDSASEAPEDFSAENSEPNSDNSYSMAEVAIEAGSIDLTPGTSSIQVVTEESLSLRDQASEVQELRRSNYSRRDSLRGEIFDQPEPAAMLTADRLLDVSPRNRPAPDSALRRILYFTTLKLVNLGDSLKVRERKALDARIGAPVTGGAKFVPVLTRKGGVGKTTITTLLGMAMAISREDRVIAIDANPDRGTLAERVSKSTRFTVRDVVNRAAAIDGFTDFSTMISRDETRLDVLASDSDPMLSEAFDEGDYNVVADMTARYYSIVLTDCGTGIVHSVMRPTLQRASGLVIVSGGSVDEARLASETLTWLEANGYGDLVRNSVVALNTATQATRLVKLDEIEQHFKTRVRHVVRVPYDPSLAAGSVIKFSDLKPGTRQAARELAALVVDGLNNPV